MADFNTIKSNLWEDDKFRRLTDLRTRLLFIYAFTNHRCPISGIYKISIETMSFESNITPIQSCKECLENLIAIGLVSYDFDKGVIWVKGKIKHDKTWNAKSRQKSVKRHLGEFSNCSFMQNFYEKYQFLIDMGIQVEREEREMMGSKESVSALEEEKEKEKEVE